MLYIEIGKERDKLVCENSNEKFSRDAWLLKCRCDLQVNMCRR